LHLKRIGHWVLLPILLRLRAWSNRVVVSAMLKMWPLALGLASVVMGYEVGKSVAAVEQRDVQYVAFEASGRLKINDSLLAHAFFDRQ
jgi:hypothetical protein